jgi:hypothetical protein
MTTLLSPGSRVAVSFPNGGSLFDVIAETGPDWVRLQSSPMLFQQDESGWVDYAGRSCDVALVAEGAMA